MVRNTLSLIVLGAALSVTACGGGNTAAPAASTPAGDHHGAEPAKPASGAKVVPPGEAKPGDTSTCPVSGEEYVVEESSPKVEHGGKTYYFCCGGCKKKFEADPSKYIKS